MGTTGLLCWKVQSPLLCWGGLSPELCVLSLELLHGPLQMSQQCFWQPLTHALQHDTTLLLRHSAVSMHESVHQAVC